MPLRDFEQADLSRVEGGAREVLGHAFDDHFERGRSADVAGLLGELGFALS